MTAPTTPTGRHIGTHPHGSDAWLAARAGGLGGSEVAAVVGMSPWTSRYTLWHQKKGLVAKESTDRMRWGHYVEPALLAWYHDNVTPILRDVGTWVHVDHNWMVANPDALTEDRGVEAKHDNNYDAWGRPGTDEVPLHYKVQCKWYMATLGLPAWDIVAEVGGNAPRVWTVLHDPEDAEWLRDEGRAFLDSLALDQPPAIDGHTETLRTVRELHPDIDGGSEVDVSDELAEAYLMARVDVRNAELAANETAARMLDVMGSANYARWRGQRIARRQSKGGGTPFLVAYRGVEVTAA